MFETQSALVNRFASLVMHGLPVDHDAGFTERLDAIDRQTLSATANREIRPQDLVTVVVADSPASSMTSSESIGPRSN